ncbi:MAG: hypothetical protein WDN28_23830 [Chthoniobacter sp.]
MREKPSLTARFSLSSKAAGSPFSICKSGSGARRRTTSFAARATFPSSSRPSICSFSTARHCLRRPLAERRLALESLVLPAGLEVAPIHRVASAADIEAAFQAARARGNEGLMIKDGASLYTPGRRGQAWLKFKKELATLDVWSSARSKATANAATC